MEKCNKCWYPAFVVAAVIAAAGSLATAVYGDSVMEKGKPPLPIGQISRIAFGSCAKQWHHQPIWDAVIAAQPDLFLFLGDAIYADTDGKTAWNVSEGQLRGEWNRMTDKQEAPLRNAFRCR